MAGLIVAWYAWQAVPQLTNPPVSATAVGAKLIRVKSAQLSTVTNRLQTMRAPAPSQPFTAAIFIKGSITVTPSR